MASESEMRRNAPDSGSRAQVLQRWGMMLGGGAWQPLTVTERLGLQHTPSNAELIKYAVNTFRATQLSFLNTYANISQGVAGADIDEVAAGFSEITKVDARYLNAGLGFGGSCLPKDSRAISIAS